MLKDKIEEQKGLYKIQFPDEVKSLFKQVFPISEGFYNWRDFSAKNVDFILTGLILLFMENHWMII